MKKFGAIDPQLTPDVEAPAAPCSRQNCQCRGEGQAKSAAEENARAAIIQLDSDFRRAAADAAKTNID